MANGDFKFAGAYGGAHQSSRDYEKRRDEGIDRTKKKKKSERDFSKANKESEKRNKNLSKWERDTIKGARKRNQERRKKYHQKRGD